ncbi:unnamed protein product [Darwinula stevensoni]|uniref:Dol-P-Glc:Glc(2)Man(9)GlcNAc(2)-PP-Dol alpha-1,2-glucosyltransferase n=1 Tax=Darwinula stevensoni TaxID=69355 RepID=A0A7R8XD70_9CRUS|nr:unnamed protein product [Darwinula stevensoni]CAG0889534.1 unnamed protein product [Darwinula stevensoni]
MTPCCQWDPKITTPPGLYLIAVGVLNPLGWILDKNLCTLHSFRLLNVFALVIHVYLFKVILDIQIPQAKSRNAISAFSLGLFPIQFTFSFFFYSDAFSTLLILLSFTFYLKNWHIPAAVFGGCSVFLRQTNILWIFLMGFNTLANNLLKVLYPKPPSKDIICSASILKDFMRRLWMRMWVSSKKTTQKKSTPLSHVLLKIFLDLCGYVLIGISFLIFLYYNGGIVLGDKSAHAPVLHIPQWLYQTFIIAFFLTPFVITNFKSILMYMKERLHFFIALLILAVLALKFNSHVHPYLLADNRHLSFYLWRRIFEPWNIFLAPLYVFFVFALHFLICHESFFFQITFYACSILTVVPQKLFEFRYFVLPFYFLRLHLRRGSWITVLLELLGFLVVDMLWLFLYVTKSFDWADETYPQRIIW